jgi:hypothetical protein
VAAGRPACGRLHGADDATPDDQRLLYWLARDTLTGAGGVIDGGPFLGSLPRALARGLEASGGERSACWSSGGEVARSEFHRRRR